MKKKIALLLAAIMIFTVLPMQVFAVDAIDFAEMATQPTFSLPASTDMVAHPARSGNDEVGASLLRIWIPGLETGIDRGDGADRRRGSWAEFDIRLAGAAWRHGDEQPGGSNWGTVPNDTARQWNRNPGNGATGSLGGATADVGGIGTGGALNSNTVNPFAEWYGEWSATTGGVRAHNNFKNVYTAFDLGVVIPNGDRGMDSGSTANSGNYFTVMGGGTNDGQIREIDLAKLRSVMSFTLSVFPDRPNEARVRVDANIPGDSGTAVQTWLNSIITNGTNDLEDGEYLEDFRIVIGTERLSHSSTSTTAGVAPGGTVELPIVARTASGETDISIERISSSAGGNNVLGRPHGWRNQSRANLPIARGTTEGQTRVTVQGAPTSVYSFKIDRLIVEELRPNSFIPSGQVGTTTSDVRSFTLTAPRNYTWSRDLISTTEPSLLTVMSMAGESGLQRAAGGSWNASTAISFEDDNRTIRIEMPTYVDRTRVNRIIIENLYLVSIVGNLGEINIDVRNGSGTNTNAGNTPSLVSSRSAGLRNETITVGSRSQWTILFDRASSQPAGLDAIPTLFTGRYDLAKQDVITGNSTISMLSGTSFLSGSLGGGSAINANQFIGGTDFSVYGTWGEDTLLEDLVSPGHGSSRTVVNDSLSNRTARLQFREEVINSWLGQSRATEFTLPEGVKFLRVDIRATSATDNGIRQETLAGTGDQRYGLEAAGRFGGTHYNTNLQRPTGISGSSNNIVVIDDQTMRWINVQRDAATTRVDFLFDVWVSIDPEFAPADGTAVPIEMQISGDAVPAGMEPVTIAMAQRPVTIETRLTDISIGFQRVPTADVTIKETTAGVLRQDFDVRFGVESPNMWNQNLSGLMLSSGDVNVTSGDLMINEFNPARNGFTVDEASTEASIIMLTNAALHVDRTVAFTNERPYDFLVFGNAVVRNHGGSNESNRRRTGFFATAALTAPYVNVRTEAPDHILFDQEVRVGIGNNFVTVNGQQIPMDAQAYVTPDGNTMVPIRFVAQAFGIPEANIGWANGTVTVMVSNNHIVNFTVGETTMVVNGSRVAMDNNGVLARAENVNGRVYIPFRHVGRALGIPDQNIVWVAETSEAVYNPVR